MRKLNVSVARSWVISVWFKIQDGRPHKALATPNYRKLTIESRLHGNWNAMFPDKFSALAILPVFILNWPLEERAQAHFDAFWAVYPSKPHLLGLFWLFWDPNSFQSPFCMNSNESPFKCWDLLCALLNEIAPVRVPRESCLLMNMNLSQILNSKYY